MTFFFMWNAVRIRRTGRHTPNRGTPLPRKSGPLFILNQTKSVLFLYWIVFQPFKDDKVFALHHSTFCSSNMWRTQNCSTESSWGLSCKVWDGSKFYYFRSPVDEISCSWVWKCERQSHLCIVAIWCWIIYRASVSLMLQNHYFANWSFALSVIIMNGQNYLNLF